VLGVSERRVRQMLADGVLCGEHIGRVWVVERNSVRRARDARRGVGRPWRAASAWAVLALANGDAICVSPVERSRARRRLESGLHSLAGCLGARAQPKSFYGHPSVLGRLVDAPDVVRSGVSAAANYAADLVAVDSVDGYVRASSLAGLVKRFALDDDADRPNVVLRVVDDDAWPFAPGQCYASLPVVAVDLLESNDERSRRAGVRLLERL
jgi:hypothetical protein